MKKLIYTGSGVALVTPMQKDGSINYEKYGELIEFQISHGTDAIIACATTGESPVLNHEEHCKALEYVIQKVNKRVPVIASTGSNDTTYAVQLSQEAERMGADALLSVTPYYNKTSQTGLIRHYTYIADRVHLPMILYNVPSRTGCNIKPETYLELSKHPNITAVKEANGDISSVAKTIALCGDDLTFIPEMTIRPFRCSLWVVRALSRCLPMSCRRRCTIYALRSCPGMRLRAVSLH